MEALLKQLIEKIECLEQSLQAQNSTWLDISEASEYLKISKSKLYKLISGGDIPTKRIGKGKNVKVLFSRRSLDLWIVTGKTSGFTKQDRQKAQTWI